MGALKALAITGVSLAVIAGGAVVGDGLARSYVEDQVARQFQAGLGLSEPPAVELGGTPFSAVFVTHRVPTATLSATDVPLEVSGQRIEIDTVEIVAAELVVDGDRITIGSGRADGLVGYPALTQLAGVPVESGGEAGRIQVSYTADLFGRELVATVSAVPTLNDARDRLLLEQPQIQVAGIALSEQIAQWIIDELIAPIDLELPYGLIPEEVSADGSGVRVAVTAEDFLIPQK
ncbi:MAG: DUF2993 domain-containing protein [Propionibacteriaceae bacterium]|nr:DUF2993 domain-containing protein [Propionibacteriaceae bacterium]